MTHEDNKVAFGVLCQIKDFVQQHNGTKFCRNSWLFSAPNNPIVQVYVRFAPVPGGSCHRLDVANVVISTPRRGIFTQILRLLEQYCKEDGYVLRVENVDNPHLHKFMRRQEDWVAVMDGNSFEFNQPLDRQTRRSEP